MNRGYVRLWRKSLDAGWIKNHKLWAFWTYCLMKATHKEFDEIVGLQVVHLIPGQFVFGRKKASKETGLTEREIRTILAFLRNAGNLTIKTTNKFSIITIINWPTYQGDTSENDQLSDQPPTSKRPHTNTITHKNIKNFSSDSVEIRLSELLFEKILSRNLKHKKPDLQTWAKNIDLMLRVDSRTPEDIRAIILWSQNHTFWPKVILSTAKLREKFDQLQVQMTMGAEETKRSNDATSRPSIPDGFTCPRCSKRIVVKADLTPRGCVYCEMAGQEPVEVRA